MSSSTRLSSRLLAAVAAVATAVVTCLAPALPATARAVPAPERPPAPIITRYTGVFEGDLTLRHRAEYGGPNYRVSDGDITIRSTLDAVRFADARLLPSSGGGTVTATGTTSATTVSDDGGHTVSCEHESVAPRDVPPFLVPVGGAPTLYPFTSISVVRLCTATDEPAPYRSRFDLPVVPLPAVITPAQVGGQRIIVPVSRTFTGWKCPGYEGDESVFCTYELDGTLTLRLVPDIDAFEAPSRPVVKRGASTVSVGVRCGTACDATLEVRPLKGSGRASTKKTLRPRVGERLEVRPGPGLRGSITAGGGARVEVTYRTGSVTKSYTYAVRV